MDTHAFAATETDVSCVVIHPLAKLPGANTSLARLSVVRTACECMPYLPTELPEPTPAVRGVYCLREPINGLWAYYNVTSSGQRLHEPRPAELGTETAFVVATLFDELELLDPVPTDPLVADRPRLTVIRCAAVGVA